MFREVLTLSQSFAIYRGARKLGGHILRKAAEKIMSHYSRLLNGEPVAEPKEEKKPESKKTEEKKRKK